MNKQQLRERIKSTIYGSDNDPIYEEAKKRARAEGLTYQETVYERAEELERDLVPDAIMQLIDQYAYEYAERVIGLDVTDSSDSRWVSREAINEEHSQQHKTNRKLSSHGEEERKER